MDQSVVYRLPTLCAEALPGELPPSVIVKLLSLKPAVNGTE
jgi:hypothetical protein